MNIRSPYLLFLFFLHLHAGMAYGNLDESFIPPPSTGPQSRINLSGHLRTVPKMISKEESAQEFGLDRDGNPLQYILHDYVDNKNGTITDYATGLIWQQNGSEEAMYYFDAKAYIRGLNRTQYAGFNDWRLPTGPELVSLIEPTLKNGNLKIEAIFDNEQQSCWSGDVLKPGNGWYINYTQSKVRRIYAWVSDWHHVRAVRSSASGHGKNQKQVHSRIKALKINTEKKYSLRGSPITVSLEGGLKEFDLRDLGQWKPNWYIRNEYIDNTDGTITDRATGLIWQKSGSESWMPYNEAGAYIDKLNRNNFAGSSAWRLPTVSEMMSLLEPQVPGIGILRQDHINPLFDKRQDQCWSSDLVKNRNSAWYVSFLNCYVSHTEFSGNWVVGHYVRAVRSKM